MCSCNRITQRSQNSLKNWKQALQNNKNILNCNGIIHYDPLMRTIGADVHNVQDLPDRCWKHCLCQLAEIEKLMGALIVAHGNCCRHTHGRPYERV